jgi:hypothetical protein
VKGHRQEVTRAFSHIARAAQAWSAMERAFLGCLDSESGEFYVQNVRREIPYNFVFEELSV